MERQVSLMGPSGSQNVFQKHGPRPAAREGPPVIRRASTIKPDELLPKA